MKNILTNYRYYVLTILTLIAIFCIFSAPSEELPCAAWYYALISSKVIGFSAAYLDVKLIRRWEKKGTIPELTTQ